MKITAIELTNIRGFKKLDKTEFSERINVFVGANNSGKSTILHSIFALQRSRVFTSADVTIGEQRGLVKVYFVGKHIGNTIYENGSYFEFNPSDQVRRIFNQHGLHSNNTRLYPEIEPNNLIYPYLSKRKTITFNDVINEQNTNEVSGDFRNLFSKIDRLVTPQFQPANSEYIRACKDILGFEISTLASSGGKKGVYFVHNQEHIPLASMGEGVSNIIGLITDLCVAENKIFLIEEPENDIHPTALKALLKLIIEKSDTNQFFISTHSNIVMKYLGGVSDTKIFNINSELSDPNRPKLFVSNLSVVPNKPEDRKAVLESLGYEFYDFELWSAWLFLEESSAEVLIRDYFIKWYAPKLKDKLRTFSANSTTQIIPKFDDFNRLFVFLHLEPVYKNMVWVIIDSGEEEKKIIDSLKTTYVKNGWNEENFSQFSEHDFEKYYPAKFTSKIKSVLAESNNQKKRDAKKALLNEVKQWILSDEKIAKDAFKTSAKSVIEKLKEIEKSI
jgi:AAA15 family ATPase/GTPase